jgi:hypothetical protein
MTQQTITAEIEAREQASGILNRLAEGDGADGGVCSKEFFDEAVLPLFRAAMHVDNHIESLSAAGCWYEEF